MRNRPLCSVCLIVFILLCAIIRLGGERFLRELRPSPLEANVREDETIQFTGQVYQKEIKEKHQVLYLRNVSVSYMKQSLKESRIIVYEEAKQKVDIGNHVAGIGEISFFETARNPGNFNQKLYYQKQNIHGFVWTKEVKVVSDAVDVLKNSLYDLRRKWSDMFCKILGEQDGSTLSAILLGEKSGMDRELKELYQVNGIAHILAISGLHLSLIGVGMYKMLRRLTGSYPVGGICGILFLLSYILMIGFTVSAVRALVMFLFRVGADMAGRHYDSPTALSVAAVIVILWRPLYIYDGGFWLSFGAVLATIIVLPIFKSLPMQSLMASISINLMLLPILLYYFYEIPMYSVFLNLLVIPLLTVLLVIGLLGSFLYLICTPLGTTALVACRGIFRLYEWCCEITLNLPGARVVPGQPEIWKVCGYYLLLAGALVLIHNTLKREVKEVTIEGKNRNGLVSNTVAVILLCAGILLLVLKCNRKDELQVTFIDVGQGDCIFMESPEGTTYLVDGGSSDVSGVGEYRIEPYLLQQGIDVLDYVFVSHGDADHLNGIEEMLDRQKVGVKIRRLILPDSSVWDESLVKLAEKAQKKGIKVLVMTAGDSLQEESFTIACIQPYKEEKISIETGNTASMVLAVHYGEFDMLLTGDVEAEGEELLVYKLAEEYAKTTWEALKVAHHGSKNSSSKAFLEVTSPVYSVISAGENNRYGHPHDEALERLKQANSKVYTTQENGAITILVKSEKMWIEGYLDSN